MNDAQILPVGGSLLYTPDFSADIPAGVSLLSVAFTVEPSGGLTLSSQSNDYANGQSTILATGSAHGISYVLKATPTLDNGEIMPKSISVLGFNG